MEIQHPACWGLQEAQSIPILFISMLSFSFFFLQLWHWEKNEGFGCSGRCKTRAAPLWGLYGSGGSHPFVHAWLLKGVSQEPKSTRREITASCSLC